MEKERRAMEGANALADERRDSDKMLEKRMIEIDKNI